MQVNAKNLIAKATRPSRHAIVKRLAPLLYLEAHQSQFSDSVPRAMTVYIKQRMGDRQLIGVEIGVQAGINAESIMRTLEMRMLYLIDPYEPYAQDGIEFEGKGREQAMSRLWKFRDRIRFIQLKAEDAVESVPSGLDFVYIDGNHQYEHVKEDIENYYRKVKMGGILGGHDFSRLFLGVIRAVTEFSIANNVQLIVEGTDWWFTKIEAFEKSQ